MPGYLKLITWFGNPAAVACDGKCNKSWGIHSRPRIQLSDDQADFEYMADDELGEAPIDPGTYEGESAKPHPDDENKLNKWCVRECERSCLFGRIELKRNWPPVEVLPDFSVRIKNQPHKHAKSAAGNSGGD